MKFDASYVGKGLASGQSRAKIHLEKTLSLEQSSELSGKLVRIVSVYPSELNVRFIELFSELTTIAETARLSYGEPFLKEEELTSFLQQSATFFNSFTHA